MAFQIYSPAFKEGGIIPQRHTCSGLDLTPALSWDGAPPATKSFVLIVDDPDAPVGNWVHWVIYDIPAERKGLEEGVAKTDRVIGVGVQGRNDYRKIGYSGPCPPPGKTHRYIFSLYALDTSIKLSPGLTKPALERSMHGHILARAQLTGTFSR